MLQGSRSLTRAGCAAGCLCLRREHQKEEHSFASEDKAYDSGGEASKCSIRGAETGIFGAGAGYLGGQQGKQ